jgi:flagellar biosynthetic protein FliR
MNPLDFTVNDVGIFTLMFFRIAGIIMFAPLFGSPNIPPQIKIMFSLVLAIVLYPKFKNLGGHIPEDFATLLLAVGSEFLVGFILGMASSFIFLVAQFAGEAIDYEMGLGLANVIDPISNEMVSVLGQLKLTIAMLIFLAIDGHHQIIFAISYSLQSLPIMGLKLHSNLIMQVSDRMITDIFVIGIRIAAPALVTMLLVNISLAFMTRLMPQLNIFAVGFGLNIVLGIVMVILMLPLFANLFERVVLNWMVEVKDLIPMMR